MNIARGLGFMTGIIVAAAIIYAFMRRANTDGSNKTKYDERQLAVRGTAYKYGFYTLVAYLIILMMPDIMEISIPVMPAVLYFTGIFISGIVIGGYTIRNDAYWGLNNNVSFYIRFLIGIGIINLLFGVVSICKGTMVSDGVLCTEFINLEAGLLLAFIGVELLAKKRKTGSSDEDGEDIEVASEESELK